jgi:hypothetical protein
MIETGLLVATSDYRDWFHTTFLKEVDSGNVRMLFADSLGEVKELLEVETIDIVFSGGFAGPHLDIMKHIWEANPTASIHIKGEGVNPFSFVSGILQTFSE